MTDVYGKCPECGASLEPDRNDCASCGSRIDTQATTVTQREPVSTWEPAPKQLGDFTVVSTIGRGGMGTVYKAYQESMRRDVALKVLDAGLFPTDEQVQRFEREAWIAGRLSHPNIVKVYGQGEAGESRYIAMELVEGPSLHAELKSLRDEKSASSLDAGYIRRIVKLFLDLTDALSYVHEQGIIHRDIKPLNLLFTKDLSRLLLGDFGLARDEETTRLTRRGDFMGTVRYMSPEQLLAHRMTVDHRSDIWSLGISLYEALTLRLPFAADSEEGYISAIGVKEPLPARHHNGSVPRELETVLMKCLERDPERRYQSAAKLRDDLKRFLDGIPVLARRPSIFRRGRSWARGHLGLISTILAGAVILGGAYIGMTFWQSHQEDRERIRFVLEQVLKTGERPSEIESEWAGLDKILAREAEKNPESELAVLRMRAYAQAEVSLVPFGLLSDPPSALIDLIHRGPYPSSGCLLVTELEASWDGGEWIPFGSCLVQNLPPGIGGGVYQYGAKVDLRRLAPQGRLTPGPHRVNVRARSTVLRPMAVPVAPGFRDGNADYASILVCKAQTLSSIWPEVDAMDPLRVDTMDVADLVINLFEDYPADFPRAVSLASLDLDQPPESWFDAAKARIVRALLPVEHSLAFAIDWPPESQCDKKVKFCLSEAVVGSSVVPVGFEFITKDYLIMPTFVAAEASFRAASGPEALVSFDLVSGPGEYIGDACCQRRGQTTHRFYSKGVVNCKVAAEEDQARQLGTPPTFENTPLEDGLIKGVLELVPSRHLALEEQSFDTYLGEKLSFPMEVEIITVPARPLDLDGESE